MRTPDLRLELKQRKPESLERKIEEFANKYKLNHFAYDELIALITERDERLREKLINELNACNLGRDEISKIFKEE